MSKNLGWNDLEGLDADSVASSSDKGFAARVLEKASPKKEPFNRQKHSKNRFVFFTIYSIYVTNDLF